MPGVVLEEVSVSTVVTFLGEMVVYLTPETAGIAKASGYVSAGPFPTVLLGRCEQGWVLRGYYRAAGSKGREEPEGFMNFATSVLNRFTGKCDPTDAEKDLEALRTTVATWTHVKLVEVSEAGVAVAERTVRIR